MNITQSILHLIPDAKFMCWENDYNRITWNDSNTKSKPSLVELEAAWVAVEANEKAMAYKEQRVAAYPPMTDYLDGIVKADNVQVQKYIDDCLAVKAKYPKGA
jgi:hypothetical protein